MAEVQLQGITKYYGKTEVLKDIDLTIQDGEFFTLVGPSGCGKSTLLHIIAGLEPMTTGEILFDGRPVGELAPRDRDVAVVFQSYALYPHMTVYDNLAFPLRMKKYAPTEIDQKVKGVVDLLGLSAVLFRHPRELSGGQRQRVALGRAIVRQPRLFLLDEPLSNLDAQLRIEMRSELKKLHAALGVTMIYVTHDQTEAMTLSGRMAVLHSGKVQQHGTPKNIYECPANLFVAGFIGNPPMNLLTGRLTPGPPLQFEFEDNSSLTIPDAVSKKVMSVFPSDRIVLGIRPEHLQASRDDRPQKWKAHVTLVEPMGSEVWIEFLWKGQKIRATAPGHFDGKIGEIFYLDADEAKIHFFDGETGVRIS